MSPIHELADAADLSVRDLLYVLVLDAVLAAFLLAAVWVVMATLFAVAG